MKLEVDRNDLFYDSFRSFAKFSGEQLQGPLQVEQMPALPKDSLPECGYLD